VGTRALAIGLPLQRRDDFRLNHRRATRPPLPLPLAGEGRGGGQRGLNLDLSDVNKALIAF
jgi:hypothetical protein